MSASTTLTFLFTDIEGSTRAWEREPDAMERWLASHDAIVVNAIAAHRGRVFKHTGDGICAVFAAAAAAARAARDIQVALASSDHEHTGSLRARIALHSGEARERAGDFFGPTLNRCARLLDAGHGGQVLLSAPTAALLADDAAVGKDVALIDLGPHRLRDLRQVERISQLAAPGLEREFAPLRSLDGFIHNLPIQRSSFIGREAEKRILRDLLERHRLVTVTGVGGCGKTRLALEVAAEAVERFPEGVFFVDLSAVLEPSLVGSTIAASLNVPPGSGTSEDRLAAFLSERAVLILVDNCEHLLDACATVIDHVLARCPRTSVLATSRESLSLDGEHVWRVPSLHVPDGDSSDQIAGVESVRLFTDRAVAVRPGFALSADNAGAVAEICRRLDGIPLALELAAARVAHLTPREIVERLADRFRLLTIGRRGIQRQQTLQAVLDWSHDLLSDAERMLLRRVSVFAGGWVLTAACAVCAGDGLEAETIVDLLGNLVSRSLVDAEDRGDHTRFRLLETVRVYAQERMIAIGEALAVRNAHATWCLSRVETGTDGADVTTLRQWFSHSSWDLRYELDNMREAAEWWLAAGRRDLMLRIAVATIRAFHYQGRFEEPEKWLQAALAHTADLSSELRARCHGAWAQVAEFRGDFLLANERARAAIDIAEHPEHAGGAYSLLVANLTWIDPSEAERLLQLAPEWTKGLGPLAQGYVLAAQGELACARGDYDRAVALFSRVRSEARAFYDVQLHNLAVAHALRGDPETAARFLDILAAETDDTRWRDYYLPFLRAVTAAVRGDPSTARADTLEALALVRRWKIPLGLADCVVACAVSAFHAGDTPRAAELLAAVRAATGGGLRSPMSTCIYRHYVRAVRAAMDGDAAARARALATGGALTLEAAVARELGG